MVLHRRILYRLPGVFRTFWRSTQGSTMCKPTSASQWQVTGCRHSLTGMPHRLTTSSKMQQLLPLKALLLVSIHSLRRASAGSGRMLAALSSAQGACCACIVTVDSTGRVGKAFRENSQNVLNQMFIACVIVLQPPLSQLPPSTAQHNTCMHANVYCLISVYACSSSLPGPPGSASRLT